MQHRAKVPLGLPRVVPGKALSSELKTQNYSCCFCSIVVSDTIKTIQCPRIILSDYKLPILLVKCSQPLISVNFSIRLDATQSLPIILVGNNPRYNLVYSLTATCSFQSKSFSETMMNPLQPVFFECLFSGNQESDGPSNYDLLKIFIYRSRGEENSPTKGLSLML